MKKTKKKVPKRIPRFSIDDSVSPLRGELTLDAYGVAWWHPFGGDSKKVSDHESLCGVGIFSTGKDDPFIEACIVHDHMYTQRAFIELHGWSREIVDNFFLVVMLEIAGDDEALKSKAHAYYNIVRTVGWIFYYRH